MAKPRSTKTQTTRKTNTSRKATSETVSWWRRPFRWLRRWVIRIALGAFAFALALVLLFTLVNPPVTHTMFTEWRRIGPLDRDWVPIEEISPVTVRSVVAAEDANFCQHWGFDVTAIRAALEEGGRRGGSTISQQVVKNVFLWQGRSWVRKALETAMTPMVEAVWSKRRIVEVYLNVAEMGDGLFGVQAAAERYFATDADALSAQEAAQLAAILPNPKERSATQPTAFLRKRAAAIRDGAATIAADGRSACFED